MLCSSWQICLSWNKGINSETGSCISKKVNGRQTVGPRFPPVGEGDYREAKGENWTVIRDIELE